MKCATSSGEEKAFPEREGKRKDFVRESRELKNGAEATFQARAHGKGWLVTKRGWPDFLCWNDQGDVFVVEIKRPNGKLKKNQAAILQLLADHGIPAFKWTPDKGFERVRTSPRRHARARSRVMFELGPGDIR